MRIAIMVDGNNLFFTCLELLFNIDFYKLYRWLQNKFKNSNIVLRKFYTSIPEDLSEKQLGFYKTITNIGYTVVKRKLKKITNDNGVVTHKGDMDAKMGFDMANFKNSYDVLVYIGGDSDFADVFQILANEGKKIIILSTQGFVASELLQLTHPVQSNVEFIDLKDVRDDIGLEKTFDIT